MYQLEQTEQFVQGDQTRRAVLGDAHVDRSYQDNDEFTGPWRQFSTEIPWGQIWSRPGLELRTRSIATVATLAAVGDLRELKLHVTGALRLGVKPEELREIFIQVAAYAGMPRGAAAIRVTREVLDETRA
jgi:alkylhydroperoxidase/carboxymuconolactone decarboxylase family protein YurZ